MIVVGDAAQVPGEASGAASVPELRAANKPYTRRKMR
jgi:hypothetical protein